MTPTSEQRLSKMLHAIFDGSTESSFVVLRNSALLPDALSGIDLDVSVLPGHTVAEVVDDITTKAKRAGWERALVSTRPHMSAVAFVDTLTSDGGALHFDVFDGISVYGVPLVSPDELLRESKTRQGVTELTDRGRVLVTVVHHLAWSGRLSQKKYHVELEELVAHERDRSWLKRNIEEVFGPGLAAEVTEGHAVHKLADRALLRKARVLSAVLFRALRRRPLKTMSQVGHYLTGQLESLRSPPGIVGLPGDRIPGVPSRELSLELACGITPLGFSVPSVRSRAEMCESLNGPRFEKGIRASWARWLPVRWIAPSLFLWLKAKRGKVLIVGRMPFTIARLRRSTRRPSWIALPHQEATPEPGSGHFEGL